MSPAARTIAVVLFPRFQLLDAVGPIDVFTLATEALKREHAPGGYRIETVATTPGEITSSAGVAMTAQRGLTDAGYDTIVVPGGPGMRGALADRALIEWLRTAPSHARRIASVCTGSFLLAQAGLLDGRRATTHWEACEDMAALFPAVDVERDAIFVGDAHIVTSAGVTTGMDLALALVEADHSRATALATARSMVMNAKRPGARPQFSAQLSVDIAERDVIHDLQAWVPDHLDDPHLSVEVLAQRAAMSTRHLTRVFHAQVGMSPAHFVHTLRMEAARDQLAQSGRRVAAVARATGFTSPEQMRRSFVRTLGIPPSEYRRRARSTASFR